MPFDRGATDEIDGQDITPASVDTGSLTSEDSPTVTVGEATDTLHLGSDQDRANAEDEAVVVGIGARATVNRATVAGYKAARDNTGFGVTAAGYQAARNNTGGRVTTAGYRAARDNTGARVTAAGYRAAQINTGGRVTAAGYRAAEINAGGNATAAGYRAARNNTGDNATAAGYQAAENNTGFAVTAAGYEAAQKNTGARVTAAGYQAARGDGLTDPTTMGDDNIGIGESAIRNNQASGLIAIGQDAGINAQTDDQLIVTDRNGTRRMEMDLTNGDLSIEGSLTQNASL